MKKRLCKVCLLLSISMLLWNCTNVIELDLPEPEQRLVVNGIFNPDSTWSVDISASQSVLSNEPYEQVQDATVGVYQADKHLYDLEHVGEGQYMSKDKSPEALENYILKVSAPGFPSAEATGFAPAEPVTHAITSKLVNTSDGFHEIEVTFTLDDVPRLQNYYFISAYYQDTSYYNNQAYKQYTSISFEAPIESEYSLGWLYFFSDKLIEGKSVTLKLRAGYPGEGRTLFFNVAQVSPDYYHYVRTLTKQAVADNFSHAPTAVHSNIKNGYGIFAGHHIRTFQIVH